MSTDIPHGRDSGNNHESDPGESQSDAYPPAILYSLRSVAGTAETPRDQAELHAPRLTKKFRLKPQTGKVVKVSSERAEWFRHRKHVTHTWDDLSTILDAAATNPHACVVRGEYVGTTPEHDRRRKVEKHTDGTGTYQPADRAWVMIDIDGLACPDGLDYIADPAAAAAYAVSLLPPEFAGASYWWSASSSYGTQAWFGEAPVLKLHIVYMLDREIADADLKRWAKTIKTPDGADLVDERLMDSIQEHYISAPVLDGITDPVAGRRSGLCRGTFERVALVLPPVEVVQPSRPKRERAEEAPHDAAAEDRGDCTARGFTAQLERIGPDGFHARIFGAALSYFHANGPRAAAGPLKAALADRIRTAPRGGRTHDYIEGCVAGLDGDIANARQVITEERRPKGEVESSDFAAPTKTADEASADLESALRPLFARVPTIAQERLAFLADIKAEGLDLSDDLTEAAVDAPWHPPRWGAKVGAGIGKTETAIKLVLELLADHPGIKIAFMVPTHRLSDGIAARINAMAGKPVAAIWRGAERDDPDNPGRKMCPNEEAAEALRRAGGGRDALCVKGKGAKRVYCPYHPDHPSKPVAPCGYRLQERQTASIWIFAHAALTSSPPKVFKRDGRDPFDMVIIDESPWLGMSGGLEHPYGMTLDDLRRGPRFELGRKSKRIDGKLVALSADEQEADRLPAEVAYARFASVAAEIAKAAPRGRLRREAFEAAGITATAAAEARKLAWGAKHDVDSMIRPGMTKDEVDTATARWALNNRLAVAHSRFWAGVVHLMAHGEPESCYLIRDTVRVEVGEVEGIRIRWREDIRPAWLAAPILHLDATMNPRLAEAFLPGFEVVAEAEATAPHARRIQVADSVVSYRKIAPGPKVTGKDAVTARNNAERLGLLLEIESAALAAKGESGLAIMPQATEAHLVGIGMATPGDLVLRPRIGVIDLAHFGNFTGVDDWRDAAKEWMVARPMVLPRVAEDIASVLFGRLPVPVEGDRYERVEVAALCRGGGGHIMPADRHPDPDAEAIRWQITDAPLIQGEARARSVRRTGANPVTIAIMTNVPLPFEIDEFVTWDSMMDKVEPVALMLARGVVPSDWAGVAGVCKELFGDAANPADAARQWFRDHPEIKTQLDSVRSALSKVANNGETPIRDSYGRTTVIRDFAEYRYQTAGKRKGATILVDVDRYQTTDAVATAITGWAGALAVCEPVKAKRKYMAKVVLAGGRVRLSGDVDMLQEWLSRPGVDPAILDAVATAQSGADLTG